MLHAAHVIARDANIIICICNCLVFQSRWSNTLRNHWYNTNTAVHRKSLA